VLSQSIENQTLRIKHVNIHNMKRGLRTQLEFIYWECNEKPVSSRIKLCPYARFAKIKLCPYAAQAAHERHPGTLCQFPRGMVAHPWPGLGFSKKCRNVTIVPLRYIYIYIYIYTCRFKLTNRNRSTNVQANELGLTIPSGRLDRPHPQ